MQQQILVIEDEKQIRDVLLDCLQLEGFETIGASDGLLGLRLAQQHLPTLIVCDIVMPKMDGFEVLLALRKNSETALIPIVFLTAKNTLSDIRRGMQLGVDDYVTKPTSLRDFVSAVSAQIEKRSLLKSCYEATFQGKGEPLRRAQTESEQSEESCRSEESPLPESVFPAAGALQPVFDFIEVNYQKPITLTEVAQAVGYSPAYLTSQVGEQTGFTVNRWIIERRMAAARSLLRNSNDKVEAIATTVGYQHACHFSRQFRKHHGQPPNAWRSTQMQTSEE